MTPQRVMSRGLPLLAALFLVGLTPVVARQDEATPAPLTAGVTLAARNLDHPRGFTWSGGALYVALAGTGGSTPGIGTPAAVPSGPLTGGRTAAVVRVAAGCPVAVARGLPSVRDRVGATAGAADVAVLGEHLYALVAGGGDAHGNLAAPNGIYRVFANGTVDLIADLSAWLRANPPARTDPLDFDPDGRPAAMIAHLDALWVVESGGQQLLRVLLDGSIARVADLSAASIQPIDLAPAPDGVYVAALGPAPLALGSAKVLQITTAGDVTDVWTGLTAAAAVAVGADGTLYALERATVTTAVPPYVTPGTGRIVAQTGPASAAPVAAGLNLPTAMDFGPDGALYVAGPDAAAGGVILRLDPPAGEPLAVPAIGPLPPCPPATPSVPQTPSA